MSSQFDYPKTALEFIVWALRYGRPLSTGMIKLLFKEAWSCGRIWPSRLDVDHICTDIHKSWVKVADRFNLGGEQRQ